MSNINIDRYDEGLIVTALSSCFLNFLREWFQIDLKIRTVGLFIGRHSKGPPLYLEKIFIVPELLLHLMENVCSPVQLSPLTKRSHNEKIIS